MAAKKDQTTQTPFTTPTRDVRIGEIASLQCCPLCDGDGFQMELVWTGGHCEREEEVPCYACSGRGRIVRLICGKCGQEDLAHPDACIDDARICSVCGHDAPHYLWLPMRQSAANDDQEETP